jgi:hypothetical protein
MIGDLQSHSGYSAAIRAYCSMLQPMFARTIGVDIHYDPSRAFEPFGNPVVTMDAARRAVLESSCTLALSCTTPERYVRFERAFNVGMTFWESDLAPIDPMTRQSLVGALNGMDALWVPASHTCECFERAGVNVPITVVPWPMKPIPHEAGMPDGVVYDLDRCWRSTSCLVGLAQAPGQRQRWTGWISRRLASRAQRWVLAKLRSKSSEIADPERRAFVCVAQDAPRKALPLLLAEWMEFKRRRESEGCSLILKSAPLNPAIPEFAFVIRFWQQVQALKQQFGVNHANVYVWNGDLRDEEFGRLITGTFGSIACGLGEGFCAPAALAVLAGKPVVAPRHTAFLDYIPENYRYAYATRPAQLSFVDDPLGNYDPMTAWNVPEPLAITEALSRLVRDGSEQRDDCCWRAKAGIERWCNPERVCTIVDEALRTQQNAFHFTWRHTHNLARSQPLISAP